MSQNAQILTNKAPPPRRIGFRDLLAPMTPEAFIDDYFERKPLHLPGPATRFADVFSWDQATALLDMTTLWSASTLKVVLNGKLARQEEYCRPQQNRDGAPIPQPDPKKVQALIRKGATISLNMVETMTPEIAAIAAALQCWFDGETVCNIYCSWGGHQGFASHFDFHDVFVLQIAGTKTWNIYEGQFDQAANIAGYRSDSFPDEYTAKARGPVAMEATMAPGDVLYIPRGRYHDALATSEATLHLTFGVEFMSACYFLGAIADALQQDTFFRKPLPRFDRPAEHRTHLQKLADQVHAYMTEPGVARGIRGQQRLRALAHCFPFYALPSAQPPRLFRVRALRTRLVRRGPGWLLERPDAAVALSADEAKLAEWLLAQDFFSADEAIAAQRGLPVAAMLDRFCAIALIDEI
jgi:ribosomal protein L16 Arg81 hydroxylase